MDKVIIIRYSEIHLKGKNRAYFENLLKKNLIRKLSSIDCKTEFNYGRYVVSDYSEETESAIIGKIKQVFGVFSFSVATRTNADINNIANAAIACAKQSGTFRITANRADKTLPYTSVSLAAEIGGRIIDNNPALTVDLHNPDFTVFIDVRDAQNAYIYSDSILGAGGMPVGCSGRGLSLLSGGIDSPVSTYMMAKRGMKIVALHFWSYPYTSLEAKQKVLDLAEILTDYTGDMEVCIVPFTKIQEAIHKYAESNYMITLVRRTMMRIAEMVAKNRRCQCIINGENLGQVASQTMESITVTNSVIKEIPVFRPLIGFDKIDIIDISQKIGTFGTSIKPYEDCCTVFLPDSPVTKPNMRRCEINESKIEGYDELIAEAVNNLEVVVIPAK